MIVLFLKKRHLYSLFQKLAGPGPPWPPPWDESNKRSRDCVKTHSGDRPFPGDNGVIKTTHAHPSLKRAERNYCNVKWKRWRGERRYHESVKALRQFKGTVKKILIYFYIILFLSLSHTPHNLLTFWKMWQHIRCLKLTKLSNILRKFSLHSLTFVPSLISSLLTPPLLLVVPSSIVRNFLLKVSKMSKQSTQTEFLFCFSSPNFPRRNPYFPWLQKEQRMSLGGDVSCPRTFILAKHRWHSCLDNQSGILRSVSGQVTNIVFLSLLCCWN